MDVETLLAKTSDHLSVRRAFGTAYEKDGMLIIPVAVVAAGLLRRGSAVPAPPPPATTATGMMSMPSFSYAVPNARRTDR